MAGEMISYWLAPVARRDFNGGELGESEPVGPFVVNDPRCNEGTLTDRQVAVYVRKLHGAKPWKIEREPWGDGEEERG